MLPGLGWVANVAEHCKYVDQQILPASSFVQCVGSVFENCKNIPGDSAWIGFCCKCIWTLKE
jgi:hypothetical protein